MLKEFKEFVARGNVIDLAVGVIIGAAFGKIVSSLVEDVMLPPIGLLLTRVDLGNLFVSLTGRHFDTLKAAKEAGAPTLNYGMFVNNVVQFFIVAFAVFLLVRAMNRFQRKPKVLPPSMRACPFCLSSIPAAASRCAHCASDLPSA